jgi:phosphorylcholine metabolism protein LicD
MNKKGVISATEDELRERQSAYLELYADLRRFFAEELGKPLMLMYGTLLGYHRDGDLIPGDDDFDAGYISDEHDPIAVKEETKRVIATLVRAGYLVSFNRRGSAVPRAAR